MDKLQKIVRNVIREKLVNNINEASYTNYNLGKVQYTDKNMTPTDILSLATAYAKTAVNNIVGNKQDYRVRAANDLAKLTGGSQLQPGTKSGKKALISYVLQNKLVSKDEYIQLYKDLVAKHISVLKALQKSSPEMRGSSAAAKAAARDAKGEFGESVSEASNKIPSFIPSVGEIDDFKLKSLLQNNPKVKNILGDKEFKFLNQDNTDVIMVSGKPFNTITTDGKLEFELDLKKEKMVKPLGKARPKIVAHYSQNEAVNEDKINEGIDATIKKLKSLISKQFTIIEFKAPAKRPLNSSEFLMVKVTDDKYGGPQSGLGKFIKKWTGVEASFVESAGSVKTYWVSLKQIENNINESVNELKEFPTKEKLVAYMVKHGHNKNSAEKVVDANYEYVKKHYKDAGLSKISDVLWTVESVNEESLYSSQNLIQKLTPKIEKEIESLKKGFPHYDINLVKNRYEDDDSYTLSISGKNTSTINNNKLERAIKAKIKEGLNEGDDTSPEEIVSGLREMAFTDLERIADYANMIETRMKEGQELDSWMYSQITLAVDQLNSVHDTMDGRDGEREPMKENADYKYLAKIILDANPKHNVYYNDSWNVVNIGGTGYDKGDLSKQFNQTPGSASTIKNNFYYANQDPQKTKREIEKLSNGKIKVNINKGIVYYSLNESVNEGARIVLVNPNTNKFVKTVIYSGPNRDADKEVEKLNGKLPNSQKEKGFYWKVSSFESVNEAKFKSPDYIISTTPASKIPPIRLAHADVSVGIKMAEKLKNYTLNVRHFKLVYANGNVALKLTPEGKTAVRVRTEDDPNYIKLIQKTVNDIVADYANNIKESVINEDVATQLIFSLILIAQAAMIGGGLANMSSVGSGYNLGPIDSIKKWWNDRKTDNAVKSIVNKIKTDPELIDFLKLSPSQQRGKFRNIVATKLSSDELKYLNRINKSDLRQNESITEGQLKGIEGIPANKKLTQISDTEKLKIVQASGNIIDFIVPDWAKGTRNFWQVISKGTIKKKKNLGGEIIYFLPGKMVQSPAYSSVKELLNGVDWASMEERRRFNESATNVTEMSTNDVHFKNILRMYDSGGSFTKKKVAAAVCGDVNATRNEIINTMKDMDYDEISDAQIKLGISKPKN